MSIYDTRIELVFSGLCLLLINNNNDDDDGPLSHRGMRWKEEQKDACKKSQHFVDVNHESSPSNPFCSIYYVEIQPVKRKMILSLQLLRSR